jgi:hypothetical protein
VSGKGTGEEDCTITDFKVSLEYPLVAPGHEIRGGFLDVIQEFTGNSTWTVPNGVTSVDVFAVGGG